jgi:hypothetical protein
VVIEAMVVPSLLRELREETEFARIRKAAVTVHSSLLYIAVPG